MLRTKKSTKGYNSVNHVHCTSNVCPLSVYEVSLQNLQYFIRYAPDKSVPDGRTDGQPASQLARQTDILTDGQKDMEHFYSPHSSGTDVGLINTFCFKMCNNIAGSLENGITVKNKHPI